MSDHDQKNPADQYHREAEPEPAQRVQGRPRTLPRTPRLWAHRMRSRSPSPVRR